MVDSARVDGRTLRYQHRRPELLAAATEYVLDHGFGDVSLRAVAQALDVTHATLIRHFSSKDELLLHVVDKIHNDVMAQIRHDPGLLDAASTAELLRKLWQWLCEPREQRQFVLLFELVGSVARQDDRRRALIQPIVDDWLAPIAESLLRDGWPPGEVPALATAILAQIRGLQLDLLMTHDRDRADRAFDLTLGLLSASRAR